MSSRTLNLGLISNYLEFTIACSHRSTPIRERQIGPEILVSPARVGKDLTAPESRSLLKQLFPSGMSYGVAFLVEYDSDSIWYETSLTIAAQGLEEVKTEYHTFDHAPSQIRESLTRLGVDVTEKERDGMLDVVDSYTAQIGISAPEGPKDSVVRQSLRIADWSIAVAKGLKDTTYLEHVEEHLHIDDNFSVLLRYNDEKSIVDWVRTRALPGTRSGKEVWFLSLATRIASDSFYRQLELVCDGILDFKNKEEEGQLAHYLRVRAMRGKSFDSRWRKLQVSERGEVTFAE